MENRLPCIYLVDSGGAFLPMQADVFPDREHFGRIFFNQARMSAAGIPQIAAVMGSCTAGGAYVPAMSDETVIVRGTGHDLPRRAAAREGGHRRGRDAPRSSGVPTSTRVVSGVADHEAVDDEHALRLVREIVANLNLPRHRAWQVADPVDPAVDPDDLYGVIPHDLGASLRRPRGDRPDGRRLGAARVQGALRRHARLRVRADLRSPGRDPREQRDPVLGVRAEGCALHRARLRARACRCSSCRTSRASWSAASTRRAGSRRTARSSSPPWRARRCRSSPSIVGGSFGAGNYAMCGRAYDPRQLWMWPNARISVMGGRAGGEGAHDRGRRPRPGGTDTVERYEQEGEPVPLDGAPVGRRGDRPARHAQGARARARRGVARADRTDAVRGLPDVSALDDRPRRAPSPP